MTPTLKPKSSVISFNWYYLFKEAKANDIVVAKVDSRLIIKRITKVNGQKVWLEGDNRKESTDSRNFGWINNKQLLGKVIMIMK